MRLVPPRSRTALRRLAPVAALALVATAAPFASAAQSRTPALSLSVLSNRADLVSGGDALVEVLVPPGHSAGGLHVDDNGRDISRAFALRPNGRVMGLVTGMRLGANVLTARVAGADGARLTLTNHPNGGPIFAGEQIQPWPCFAAAVDSQCNQAVVYQYYYSAADGSGFKDYDPASPPPSSQIATTTTDQGRTVPYVVRQETGAQDRGEYRIAVLDDPAKGWKPWAPQPGWNGKTYITGGSGCGMHHGETSSPDVMDDNALSRGFAVISTSLDHNTQNCNIVVQAESLMMLKERVTEAYGPIAYTIGSGCSGGSIYQQQVANAYPGIFDGLLPACSFPDSWSTLLEVDDCALMVQYWTDPTRWAPGVVWTEPQEAASAGHPTTSICHSWRDVYGFSETLNAQASTHPLDTQSCNVPAGQTWSPSNPSGVRCDLQDYMVSVFGSRPDGKANRPWDNVGVQYGLAALRAGSITPAQFVDLNAKIGSHDIDYLWQPSRVAADRPALPIVYRSGAVDEADHLAGVPIIDLRGHDVEEIHHDYRSYVMRARLDRAQGNHDNQVIWTGAAPLTGDTQFASQALDTMDQWLAAVKADSRRVPLATKVAQDKPALARDRCTDGLGHDIADQSLCPTLNPYYASPRIVAGSAFTEDAMKCQLKPLRQSDYSPVQFTSTQWAQLQATFPSGVCDWSRPGVGQQGTVPWSDYSAGPGGRRMPAAPRSVVVPG